MRTRPLAPAAAPVLLVLLAVGLHAQRGGSGIPGFPTAQPEDVGMSSMRLNRLREALDREIGADRIPGAVVAIARHGQLVFYEAFGYLDKEAGVSMRKDAIFAIASMTKPIFSVAAMQLLEEGRLLMNTPVATYLPELSDRPVAVDDAGIRTEPAVRQPVVQDLLRHTSGWVGPPGGDSGLHGRYPDLPVTEPLTGEQYLARLSDLPLRYHLVPR